MADILIPHYPGVSYCDWIGVELILPNGFVHVASVERPGPDGQMCGKGEMWDLGVKEGVYRLFRRGKILSDFEFSHVGRGESLSDEDLIGFGLTRADSPLDQAGVCDDGYSSLNRAPEVRKLIGV
jgi:hypothetical protein